MTPVLREREEKNEILEESSRLDKFDDSKWVFTDITMNVPNKVRSKHCRGLCGNKSW